MTNRSSRPRVLHIIPSFNTGGAEHVTSHLIIELAKSCEVTAASFAPARHGVIEDRLKQAGIPHWCFAKHRGFDPQMMSAVDRVVGRVQPHIVHTHLSVLRYVVPSLLRHRVPVAVHTLHNLAQHETDAFGRLLHRFVFRKLVLPIAISLEVATSVRRLYGMNPYAVVPNGIPVHAYCTDRTGRPGWREREGFAQDDILLICVGRLEIQKNPFLLLEAFEALGVPQAHLLLLGDGSLRLPLTTFIQARQLQNRIHLLGRRNDVSDCLAASDIFVLASDWEGNPLAVMEAMAVGLPVIATSVGGVPELVDSGRDGYLVKAGARGHLSEAMARLICDPGRRALMGEAARHHALSAFSAERMGREYCAVYSNALAERSRSPQSHVSNGEPSCGSYT